MFHVKQYDDILYKLALKSYKKDEIPVGSIVIYKDKIIGKGYNNRQSKNNVCGHAEINAILNAEKKIKDWRLNDCIIISTLKPCNMCYEIIKESRINKIYYILDQKNINYNDNSVKKINIDDNKYKKLINLFFESKR